MSETASWAEPGALPGRKRDRDFADALIEELPKEGDLDSKLIAAAKKVWVLPVRRTKRAQKVVVSPELQDKRLLAKAKAKLETGPIWRQIADVYEVAASFSIVDAARLHVDHIQGNLTEEKVDKMGQVVEVKIAPNYAALRDFQRMTLPAAVKQVQVDQRTLSIRMTPGQEPPPLRARVLGTGE